MKYIINKVQDENFIVILHNCGNTGQCTKAMVSTGAAAYHFGNKCQMEEVIRDVPPTALAMGNIDPVSVFKDGTPEEMRKTVLNLLDKMKDYPNFVLSSGCDTPPHTPIENIIAFFDALNEWRKTANVVYAEAFKGNAIAVDTHVFRVSNRLGLADAKTPEQVEQQLMQGFDEELWPQLHHLLIFHGRYTCHSQRPNCEVCEAKDLCKYYKNHQNQ